MIDRYLITTLNSQFTFLMVLHLASSLTRSSSSSIALLVPNMQSPLSPILFLFYYSELPDIYQMPRKAHKL